MSEIAVLYSESYHNNFKNVVEENKQLKAVVEQLYKEKEQLQKSQYCVAYEKDCHLVCKRSGCKLKDYHKYKQCLDEIEKVVQDKVDDSCSLRDIDCNFSCNKCLFETLDKILQLTKQRKDEL